MNILFLGRFYPCNILNSIVKDTRGKVGFSNHNFEQSLIKGFSCCNDVCLRVLSAPMVFSFPHNNKNAFIKKNNYLESDYTIRSIGFCNIAIVNIVSEIYALTKAIRQEISNFESDRVTIIVNTPSLILSTALFKTIKKIKGKEIKTVLIVPDIPECMLEMNGNKSLKNKLVQCLNKRNAKLSLKYDKYVYLTEAMNDFYHANSKDYIVMEGLIDDSKANVNIKSNDFNKKEIILYTGSLSRIFGIMDLVNMFETAQFQNCELWICGSGECASEIEELAKSNSNIKFYGLVDSNKAILLQSKATILANPRSANGNYTKYSFPSKTIEYLMAGKTVIMNRLPGIPTEYDKYLHYPQNETSEAWKEKLMEIFKMDNAERKLRNDAGREFIIEKKLASIQCARIAELSMS